jgi:hypothetical protein
MAATVMPSHEKITAIPEMLIGNHINPTFATGRSKSRKPLIFCG